MKLGSQGLEVSMHGLHSMVLQSQNDMIALIHHAIESGVTFLDTSDALKGGVREKVELATMFGISYPEGKWDIRGDPAYAMDACEGSLKRLGIDCIDLYYQHCIDTRVPIEVTVGVVTVVKRCGGGNSSNVQNIGALSVKLTPEEMAELESLAALSVGLWKEENIPRFQEQLPKDKSTSELVS
ncbi:hypothetical protein JHK87_033712 [Glycine soja]|nr:hypothetical protein JHK87_033712 [Glycine soja]